MWLLTKIGSTLSRKGFPGLYCFQNFCESRSKLLQKMV